MKHEKNKILFMNRNYKQQNYIGIASDLIIFKLKSKLHNLINNSTVNLLDVFPLKTGFNI